MNKHLFLLILLALSVGCDNASEHAAIAPSDVESPSAEQSDGVPEIQWFDGTIEAAFAAAAGEERPLFFYWGAVWCPPCQEIRHTVFKSQAFIDLTRLFIPVYLDGDTDRAQSWGEKFGVKGYPTMIIFSPAGDEVTRIPGGIDIDRYNDVLALSLNRMKPTSALVQLALTDPERLTASDLRQLAYYSWGQDSAAVPEDADLAGMFHALSTVTADDEISTRFYLSYLLTLATADDPSEVMPVEGDDPVQKLDAILSDGALTITGWDTLAYWSEEIMALSFMASNEALEQRWADAVFVQRFNEKLSKAEKLAGWFPRLLLLTKGEQTLADDIAASLRQEMAIVDADTPDSYERQSVINQMSHVYRSAGLIDDAKTLLLAELDKSASPYYFMSGLGALAENDKDFAQALDWRRRAYESAIGEATRFQWGTNYVTALTRMAPDDAARIQGVADELLSSFEDPEAMFSGRNFRVLGRLNMTLQEWQAEHNHAELSLVERIKALCDGQTLDSQAGQNCRSLLDEGLEEADENLAQAS